jgi:hypothetical protein
LHHSQESYFSRLRRSEVGHHHHIAGPYLVRYAQEAAWRKDQRRVKGVRRCRVADAVQPVGRLLWC